MNTSPDFTDPRRIYVPKDEALAGEKAAKRLYAELSRRELSYCIESYGCQMNDHDSEKLAGMLRASGYCRTADRLHADLVIFNTCCVREHAELKVFGNIGALKEIKEQHPGMIIAVCGCMMQQEEVARKLFRRFPFVDIVFGTNELHLFPVMLEKAITGERVFNIRRMEGEIPEGLPIERKGSFSACVTIMYGCDNFCTYCIVPYVRGRERSRAPVDILNEVKSLSAQGYKEVTLLGQNVNSYKGDSKTPDFPALLRLLDRDGGIPRLRFMTSHPKDLSMELIRAMAECDTVCSHIHLPVQSGSDSILRAMNRRYDSGKYLSLVNALRSEVRDIEITTDMIVGFPGETDRDFQDTLDLVRKAGFAAAFTFMYSPRTGTKAATMEGQIPLSLKKARLSELNRVQEEVLREGNKKYIGYSGEVLAEGCDRRGECMAYGKLSNFKMVYFPGTEELTGSLCTVRITDMKSNSLIGELINK